MFILVGNELLNSIAKLLLPLYFLEAVDFSQDGVFDKSCISVKLSCEESGSYERF